MQKFPTETDQLLRQPTPNATAQTGVERAMNLKFSKHWVSWHPNGTHRTRPPGRAIIPAKHVPSFAPSHYQLSNTIGAHYSNSTYTLNRDLNSNILIED